MRLRITTRSCNRPHRPSLFVCLLLLPLPLPLLPPLLLLLPLPLPLLLLWQEDHPPRRPAAGSAAQVALQVPEQGLDGVSAAHLGRAGP